MEVHPLDHEIYETENGFAPYEEWLDSLSEEAQGRIIQRINKLSDGLLGVWKSITKSDGIIELIEDFGPGYRIYCRKIGKYKYLILYGGKKGEQRKCITKAKDFLKDYQNHN